VAALLPISLLERDTDCHAVNPFGVLAGLAQSPTETKWAFDSVLATSTPIRRRGKRTGQHYKSKHTRKSQSKRQKSESVNDVCKRLVTIRPKDDAQAQQPRQGWQDHGVDLSKPSATFSTEGAWHHWEPQSCSDSLPTISTLSDQATKPVVQKDSLDLPEAVLHNDRTSRATQICSLRHDKQSDFLFPGSPLLPDLAVNDEPLTKSLKTSYSESAGANTQILLTPPPSTSVQIEATPTACIVFVSKRTGSYIALLTPPLDAGEVGSTSSTLYAQTSSLACLANAETSPAMAPSLSAVHDVDVCQVCAALKRWKGLSPITPYSDLPSPLEPKTSADGPLAGLGPIQPCFFEARRVQQAPISTWTEPSEGIIVFKPYPLITAPVTSPYPFVNSRQRSSPPVSPRGLFNDQPSASIMERRKAALIPISLQEQRNRDDFLAMGHPSCCWCGQHTQSNDPLGSPVIAALQTSTLPRVEQAPTSPVYKLDSIPHSCDSLEILPISLPNDPKETEYFAHPIDNVLPLPKSERASKPSSNTSPSSTELCSDDWTVVTPKHYRRMHRSQSLSALHAQPSTVMYSTSSSSISSPSTPINEYELLIVSSSPSVSWYTSPLLSPIADKTRFS
jgi:hypothetical protein